MRSAVAAILLVAPMFLSIALRAQGAPAIQQAGYRQQTIRPRVASNATSFVVVPFPSPHPSAIGNVVFVPNGTAYFTDAKSELASFTPGGVYTRIPVPHALLTDTLLYAHGVFWMNADQGLVKVAPDGSRRRWYTLASPGYITSLSAIVAGPDGGIYAIGSTNTKNFAAGTNNLFRIGTNGAVTTVPLSVNLTASNAVFGPDNLLYFGYFGSTGSLGIARMNGDGSLTLFPIAGSTKQSSIGSFVVSRGIIYFNYSFYDTATKYYTNQLGRFTLGGGITMTTFPTTGVSAGASSLSVDKGGNLWVVINNAYATNQFFLYQFNVYTAHFNGPYLTGLPNEIYGGPIVAPDDNVWIALPANSGVDYFQPIGFAILQRGT